MNRMVVFFFTVFLMLNIASGIRAEETSTQFGRFGKIAVYQPSPHPAHVVLFVFGDGGWNLRVVDMARELAALESAFRPVHFDPVDTFLSDTNTFFIRFDINYFLGI